MRQRPVQHGRVAALRHADETLVVIVLRIGSGGAEEPCRQSRDDREGPCEPGDDGQHHRLRHRLEQLTLDPAEAQHRHIDQSDDRDAEEGRPRDHLRRMRDDVAAVVRRQRPALFLATHGHQSQAVLDHHDRAIDDQPEVERAKAHQIARHADRMHARYGDEEGERNDERHDQRRPPIAHHEQQYERHQQRAFAQILFDRVDGAIDQIGAAILAIDHYALGQRRADAGQRVLDRQRGFAAVLPDEHHHGAQHRLTPVLRRRTLSRGRADHDIGKVAHLQGQYASGELDRDRADLRRVQHARVGADGEAFGPAPDDAAARILDILRHRRGKLASRDAMQPQPHRIGRDDELFLQPAVRIDVGDARHRAQHRADGVFLRLVQLHQLALRVHARRRAAPFERIVVNLTQTGGDRGELRRAAGGQLVLHRRQPFGDELARLQLIGAVLVEQRDLAEPGLGQRAGLVEPRLAAHRALDRQRHQPLDLLRSQRGHLRVDLHLHARDIGDRIDLQVDERPQAGCGNQGGDERHRKPVVRDVMQPAVHRASGSPPLSARNCSSASSASRRVSSIALTAST